MRVINTARFPFIVGAYAALPEREKHADFYALLRDQEWITGLELPYPGDWTTGFDELVSRLDPRWSDNSITAIPGTMQAQSRQAGFGLASASTSGRQAALSFTRDICETVKRAADTAGRAVVTRVQLHSAPTNVADDGAFLTSLEEIASWDWSGAGLVIEHCDQAGLGHEVEKGFLPLADELRAAQHLGLKVHLNWGRSVLETRDPRRAVEHVRQSVEAGCLAGVMFSGVSPAKTQYGYEWIDGHVPTAEYEDASLLTLAAIVECVREATGGGSVKSGVAEDNAYFGAKICVPKNEPLDTRVEMIKTIYDHCVAGMTSPSSLVSSIGTSDG